MFNNSIESKIVPDTFMISKVTPVFRASVLTDPGNYHPIVVLSPFAKILKRLVYKYQLNHFLEKEKILFKHQFCFKKNNSTEQAILELTDNLKMTVDSSETKCSIFFSAFQKPLILLTIRSYCRNYTAMESMVFHSNGLKAILRTEHDMLKLEMLNQALLLSNMVYLRVLLLAHFYY